jgi:hypothetical protein
MRKAWMDWVAKTRKKGNRGKDNSMTHREALKAAAVTWPKEKAKLIRRQKRVCKKKAVVKPPEETQCVRGDENALA